MPSTVGVGQVLAKANRIARAEDFKAVTRTGNRLVTDGFVVYLARRESRAADRYGFIVAKSVGSAVVRNRVRRRLRAIARELVVRDGQGTDVVIRALPGAAHLSWANLHSEVIHTVEKGLAR